MNNLFNYVLTLFYFGISIKRGDNYVSMLYDDYDKLGMRGGSMYYVDQMMRSIYGKDMLELWYDGRRDMYVWSDKWKLYCQLV